MVPSFMNVSKIIYRLFGSSYSSKLTFLLLKQILKGYGVLHISQLTVFQVYISVNSLNTLCTLFDVIHDFKQFTWMSPWVPLHAQGLTNGFIESSIALLNQNLQGSISSLNSLNERINIILIPNINQGLWSDN